MGRIGAFELILILLIALVIFGPSKLPQIGRSFGQAIREFRRGSKEISDEFEELTKEDPESNTKA
ncbi:MAG: twin-arginine translocase TatA/TatE family subunit [Clostridiales bacterium]|jgi:sec-independent protein translocase protein TatA|nr:twin-arginine translocase TatA/TatE family subunit [Clostridiales bacterium]